MRFQAIASQATLIAVLQLAWFLADVGTSEAQQSDHVRLSTPVVKAWREIQVGSPVCALDDLVGSKNWLERALIQKIDAQTGIWYIWVEPGYSVFRIYPYLSKDSPPPSVYQGIVLKVNGTLSVDDLLKSIRSHTSTVTIDEYDIFGTNSVSIQRYSRHDEVLFEKAMSAMRQEQFTVANLTLRTLVNTYPESNYARKAKVVLQNPQIAKCGQSWSTDPACDSRIKASPSSAP